MTSVSDSVADVKMRLLSPSAVSAPTSLQPVSGGSIDPRNSRNGNPAGEIQGNAGQRAPSDVNVLSCVFSGCATEKTQSTNKQILAPRPLPPPNDWKYAS